MDAHAQASPLEDVRVLAFEQFGAGPWATLQLLDLGAEVIKVEDPLSRGDISRYVPPFQSDEDSLLFESLNRGKRSISLDLRSERGRQVLQDLAQRVDIVFCNLRGDQPARLGLTYADLRHVNPALVCCSVSGFGMTGPRASQGAYDNVIQGMAGWMSLTGDPDAPPTKSGLSLVDFTAGYCAAIAMLGAFVGARRSGIGMQCDISLQETALSLLNYNATWALSADHRPARHPNSSHASIVPFQAMPTADGWITVACAKESFWHSLCHCIGRPDLLDDPRFADFASRDRNREALLDQLYSVFATAPSEIWLARLAGAGVPSGPVNDLQEALRDPQVLARDSLVSVDHPKFGTVWHVASPLRISGRARQPGEDAIAPVRGGDTEAVLISVCGYSEDQIADLALTGAFGEQPSVRS
jgi:crotonobetainyl-CoA:carnitine CoA-transferase CaiB-like acyl-CoA transferase